MAQLEFKIIERVVLREVQYLAADLNLDIAIHENCRAPKHFFA